MPKITLDAEAFKVLASDTRLQILKSLDERPKTVSELARELALNKATVHEHLQQLLTGELIKKNERDGRKWVYYTLSWKGKSLLHPENTTVLVLLGLAAIGSAGAIVQLGNWLRWWGATRIPGLGESEGDGFEKTDGAGDTGGSPEAFRMAAPAEDEAADGSGDGDFFDFLHDGDFWLFAVLFLIASAALVAAGLVKQHARNRRVAAAAAEPAEIGAVKSGGNPDLVIDPETDADDVPQSEIDAERPEA